MWKKTNDFRWLIKKSEEHLQFLNIKSEKILQQKLIHIQTGEEKWVDIEVIEE